MTQALMMTQEEQEALEARELRRFPNTDTVFSEQGGILWTPRGLSDDILQMELDRLNWRDKNSLRVRGDKKRTSALCDEKMRRLMRQQAEGGLPVVEESTMPAQQAPLAAPTLNKKTRLLAMEKVIDQPAAAPQRGRPRKVQEPAPISQKRKDQIKRARDKKAVRDKARRAKIRAEKAAAKALVAQRAEPLPISAPQAMAPPPPLTCRHCHFSAVFGGGFSVSAGATGAQPDVTVFAGICVARRTQNGYGRLIVRSGKRTSTQPCEAPRLITTCSFPILTAPP